jgi:hypothetical protein
MFHCHGGIINTQPFEIPPGFVFHFYTEPQESLYGKMRDPLSGLFNPVERQICQNLKVKLSKGGRLFSRKAGQNIPNFMLVEDHDNRFQARVTFCKPCTVSTVKGITDDSQKRKELQELIDKADYARMLVQQGLLPPQSYEDAQLRVQKAQRRLDRTGREIFHKDARRKKSPGYRKKGNKSKRRCGEILALDLIDETDLLSEMKKLTTQAVLNTSTINDIGGAFVEGCVVKQERNPVRTCMDDGKVVHVHCLFCLSNIPGDTVFKYPKNEKMYTQDRISFILHVLAPEQNLTNQQETKLIEQVKKASTLPPSIRRRVMECMTYDNLRDIDLYVKETPEEYIESCTKYINAGGKPNETKTWFEKEVGVLDYAHANIADSNFANVHTGKFNFFLSKLDPKSRGEIWGAGERRRRSPRRRRRRSPRRRRRSPRRRRRRPPN